MTARLLVQDGTSADGVLLVRDAEVAQLIHRLLVQYHEVEILREDGVAPVVQSVTVS